MTKDYRKEWGVIEAVRELVQNCLDNKNCEHMYEYVNGVITITTRNFVLPMETFALGESQNKTDSSIGGFGEGFKLALLILQRESCEPLVKFGSLLAKAQYVYDEATNRELFEIHIQRGILSNSGNTTFSFKFPKEQEERLRNEISTFNNHQHAPSQDVNYVELLPERPGEIFVNGLFVCNVESFKYGYNFSPETITLGCDRQITNPLGLAWETSNYWAKNIDSSQTAEEVLQMITDGQLDVQDIHWHITEEQATKVTTAFSERYGNVTIKPMGSTLSYGMGVGSSMYNTLRKSGKIAVANPHEEKGTIYNDLLDMYKTNKKHMRRCAKRDLLKLIEKSKSWRK